MIYLISEAFESAVIIYLIYKSQKNKELIIGNMKLMAKLAELTGKGLKDKEDKK